MPKLIQDRITNFLICNNSSTFFPPLTVCDIHNNFHDKFHNYQVDMLLLIHTTVCLINIKSTELINVILSSDIYNLSYFCLRLLTSMYLKQSSHLNYSQLIRAFVSSNLFVCTIKFHTSKPLLVNYFFVVLLITNCISPICTRYM